MPPQPWRLLGVWALSVLKAHCALITALRPGPVGKGSCQPHAPCAAVVPGDSSPGLHRRTGEEAEGGSGEQLPQRFSWAIFPPPRHVGSLRIPHCQPGGALCFCAAALATGLRQLLHPKESSRVFWMKYSFRSICHGSRLLHLPGCLALPRAAQLPPAHINAGRPRAQSELKPLPSRAL